MDSASRSKKEKKRLDELLSGLVDGRLRQGEMAELERLLEANDAAQQRYARFMLLHGNLAWGREGREVASETAEDYRPRPTPGASRPRIARRAVAATIVAAGVLAVVFLWKPWERSTAGELGCVTQTVACRWAAESSVDDDRRAVQLAAPISLAEGMVEIVLTDGTRLVLEGPTELQLRAEDEVSLASGSLCVRVAADRAGFVVAAGGLRITDRGTEFGVRVADSHSGCDVQVFEGEVAVDSAGRPQTARTGLSLTSGEAAHVTAASGKLVSSPANGAGFVRDLQGAERIVDFSGNYLSAARNNTARLARHGQWEKASFRADERAGDAVYRVPLSESEPLSPLFKDVPKQKTREFFGGYEIWRVASAVPTRAGQDTGLGDGGDEDFVRLWYSNGADRRVFGAWVFLKQGFLALSDERVVLGRASGLLVDVSRNLGGHYAVRFLVRSNGIYYLSQSVSNREGIFSLSGSQLLNELWTKYDPMRDLRANGAATGNSSTASNLVSGAGALTYDLPTSALSNIEAVGLYAESVDLAAWPNRQLDWRRFTVHAEATE